MMNHPGTASINAAPSNKVSRVTDFDTINEALSFASTIATRIECLADRFLGSEPSVASRATDTMTPDGVLPLIAASASYARGRLGDASAALDRIERALP